VDWELRNGLHAVDIHEELQRNCQMNIAVYAISKNESRHVKAFMDSIEACGFPVYVLDHSTDDTADLLRARGAIVDHTPIVPFSWCAGKNTAMNLVPEKYDILINMDLDETLVPNAREIVESAGRFDILQHLYRPEEAERIRFCHRVHRRGAAKWTYPIHEELIPTKKGPLVSIERLLIEHHPPRDKSHSIADRLIEYIKEHPNDSRMMLLCARDLYFEKRHGHALEYLHALTTKITRDADKKGVDRHDIKNFRYAKSLMAKCHEKLGDKRSMIIDLYDALRWRKRSFPRREAWVELSYELLRRGDLSSCVKYACNALRINDGRYEANCDPGAWSFKPFELLMQAHYGLQNMNGAIYCGEEALKNCSPGPDAERIRVNLDVIKDVGRSVMEDRGCERHNE